MIRAREQLGPAHDEVTVELKVATIDVAPLFLIRSAKRLKRIQGKPYPWDPWIVGDLT
jgi:hypothetical protein